MSDSPNPWVILNNGMSPNMIPVQPAPDMATPVASAPTMQESIEQMKADQLAKASVNDPYAATPSIVLPGTLQAEQEAIAQQGSYPTFQAGGPQDIQNMLAKNAALAAQAQPEEQPIEAVQTDASRFSAPPLPQLPTTSEPSAVQSAVNGLQSAYNMQQRGIEAAADAGAKKAIEETAYREQYDKQLAQKQISLDKQTSEINQAVDLQMKDLETLKTELSDFKFSDEKVDPNRLWNSKTTGGKILAAVAIGLGGYGGAYSGKGGNPALDIINKAIDKDIEAQKFNISNTRDKEKMQIQNKMNRGQVTSNMLSSLNQKFNNTMQAEQATRYLMLEQTKNKLETVASKYQGPELKAKAQVLVGQLNAESAKSLYAFKAAGEQQEMMKKLFSSDGKPGQLTAQQITALPKELRERFVPGYGFASSKESVTAFQKVRAENEPPLKGVGELLKMGNDIKGMKQLSPTRRAEMETKLTILAGQLRLPVTGPGSMQQAEYERLRTALGDPAKILSLNAVELKKLGIIQKFLEANIEQAAAQYGLAMPAKTDYTKVGFTPSK